MRIKELFTVPEGTKVTEKLFGKVLLSTVCSILLCMACLVSTTWAWFAVEIENTENVLWIAKPTVEVVITNTADSTSTTLNSETGGVLSAGSYTLNLCLKDVPSGTDDLNRTRGKLYVLMQISHNGAPYSYYFTFNGTPDELVILDTLRIADGTATVSFCVSWVRPASATEVGAGAIVIGTAAP